MASDCDCLSKSSVRMLAAIVLSTMPMLSVNCSSNAWWAGLNCLERRQLEHGLHLAFEQHGQHDDAARRGPAKTGAHLRVIGGNVREQDLLAFDGALADESFAKFDGCAQPCAAAG